MMDKMENLRAGITEMRSVAQKLMAWADDLEASFRRDASAGGNRSDLCYRTNAKEDSNSIQQLIT